MSQAGYGPARVSLSEAAGQPICICWRFGTSCIFSTGPSTWIGRFSIVYDQVDHQKDRSIMSLQKPKAAVYVASMRLYTLGSSRIFRWLGVVFTSDVRRNRKIDTRIAEQNAVLHEIYRSVVTKREIWKAAKLSLFKSAFLSIFIYGRVSWESLSKCYLK